MPSRVPVMSSVVRRGRSKVVRYQEPTPMLLNEPQLQRRTTARQEEQLRGIERQLTELQDLKRAMRGRAAGQ
jgi:hypothetical protein